MSNALLDNVDLWTGAVRSRSTAGRGSNRKIELVGVKKLRELILELAVRGKLVPQDASDEPASELLKGIEAEKAQLIKDGKIKKQKPLPPVGDDEKPFELPSGWEWSRLGTVASYGNPKKAEPSNAQPDTWVLELEDIEKETSKLLAKIRYVDREFKSTKNVFSTSDVLYGKLRPYLDKVIVADESGVCTTEIIPITCFDDLSPFFIRLLLKSPRFIDYASNSTHGMNLPRLGTEKAVLAALSIPPLAEQHRIVAKVDELMQLCDQLEQHTDQQHAAHQQLVETLLNALTQASSAADLAEQWQRIATHFDELFVGAMGEWAVDRLKDSILQLAVMGKLVPQDPSEEPASELLKRIEAKKIKLNKILATEKKASISFCGGLPKGWILLQLGEIAQFQKGYAFKSNDYTDNGLMITKIQNLTENSIQNAVYINLEKGLEYSKYLIFESDIVMTTVGSWFSAPNSAVGRVFLINSLFDNTLLNQNAVRIRAVEGVDSMYLYMYISSLAFKDYLVKEAQGTANQASITQESIKDFKVYIPPLAEQHRIVAKVDQLFALCDQLKTRIHTANHLQLQLTEAVVEQTLA